MARDGDGMLFPHSAHHHTEVARFDHDSDALGLEYLLECVTDLLSETLLDLEPTREHVDDAGDFTETDDFLVWDVADVDFAREGEQVVLAEGVALDVFHDDHAIGICREECAVDDFLQILIVSGGEKCHGFSATFGCFLESWP